MNTVSSDAGLCISSGAHVHLPSWLDHGGHLPSPRLVTPGIWDGVWGVLKATLNLALRRQVPKKDTTRWKLLPCSWLTGEVALVVAKWWPLARVSSWEMKPCVEELDRFLAGRQWKHQSFLLPGCHGALRCSEVSHPRLIRGGSSFGSKLGHTLVAAPEGGHLVNISVFFLDARWCPPAGHYPGRAHG